MDARCVLIARRATAEADLGSRSRCRRSRRSRLDGKPSAGVLVRARVARDVPYELRRQGTLLTVLFGAEVAGAGAPRRPPTCRTSTADCFPPPAADRPRWTRPARRRRTGRAGGGERGPALRPPHAAAPTCSRATWTPTAALLDTAAPVRDRYFEIAPARGGRAALGAGHAHRRLRAAAAAWSRPRARWTTPTHLANAQPRAPRRAPDLLRRAATTSRRACSRRPRSIPGREYFFDLGRFTRNEASARPRVETRRPPGRRPRRRISWTAWTDRPAGGLLRPRRPVARAGHRLRDRRHDCAAPAATRTSDDPARAGPSRRRGAAHSALGHRRTLGRDRCPWSPGHDAWLSRPDATPRPATGGQRYPRPAALERARCGRNSTRVRPRCGLLASREHATLRRFEDERASTSPPRSAAELNARAAFSAGRCVAASASSATTTDVVATGLGRAARGRHLRVVAGLGRPVTRWRFVRADYRHDQRDSNIDPLRHRRALADPCSSGLRLYRRRGRAMIARARLARPRGAAAPWSRRHRRAAPRPAPAPAPPAPLPTPSPSRRPAPTPRRLPRRRRATCSRSPSSATTTSRAPPTVQTNGTISLPLLGEVPVAGLTVRRGQAQADRRSSARDYLVNPQVEVQGQGVPEPVRDRARRGEQPRAASRCAGARGSSTCWSSRAASRRGPRARSSITRARRHVRRAAPRRCACAWAPARSPPQDQVNLEIAAAQRRHHHRVAEVLCDRGGRGDAPGPLRPSRAT